jgi:N-acetylneuraminic acid mutarotase
MRRTITTSLVLAFSLSALGGSTLAQAEPELSPSLPPATVAEPELVDGSVVFAEPGWRKVAAGDGPPAREDHTWTVDTEGRFAYLFGGRSGDREFSDLWRYDLARDSWKKISPKGATPEPRFGHNAVWVDDYGMVVFAGQRGVDFFDDLWAFDPQAKRWRELPAKGQVPKRRYGSCMVVGPDGRLWISHGFTFAGRFDDTRAYNLKSKRWAVITPTGRKPGERCLHECFTTTAGDLVLYGGQDNGSFALGDLWSMGREGEWDRHDDPMAQPRRLYGVTEAGGYAYVFGGAGVDNAELADLWRVNRETLEFERVSVDGSHPAGRYAGSLITDAERGRLLLFGGEAASGTRSDVWELVETAEPEVVPTESEGPLEVTEAQTDV